MFYLSFSFLSGLLTEAFVKHNLSYFDLPSVSTEQMNGDRLELFRCCINGRTVGYLYNATRLTGWDLESTIMVLDFAFNGPGEDLEEYSHGDEKTNRTLSQLAVLLYCLGMPHLEKDLMENKDYAINIFGKELKHGDSLLMDIMMDVLDSWNLAYLLQNIKDRGVAADEAFLYGALSARHFFKEWSTIVWDKNYKKLCNRRVDWIMDFVHPAEDGTYDDSVCNNTVLLAEEWDFKIRKRPYTKTLCKEFPEYGLLKGFYRVDCPVVEWIYEFEQYGRKYKCSLIGNENGPLQKTKFVNC